jgi:hypothetical protein
MNSVIDDSLVGLALLVSGGYAFAVASVGKTQGACGGCDDCGSGKAPAKPVTAEIIVPMGKIGRRT